MRSLECKVWEIKERCPIIKNIQYSREGEITIIRFNINQYVYNYTIIFDTIYRESGLEADDVANQAYILNTIDSLIDKNKTCEDCVFNFQRKLNKCSGHYFIKNKFKKDGR